MTKPLYPNLAVHKLGARIIAYARKHPTKENAERLAGIEARLAALANFNVIGASDDIEDRIVLAKISQSPNWFDEPWWQLWLAARAADVKVRPGKEATARETGKRNADVTPEQMKWAEDFDAHRAQWPNTTIKEHTRGDERQARFLRRLFCEGRSPTPNERRKRNRVANRLTPDTRAAMEPSPANEPASEPATDAAALDREFDELVERSRRFDT